jgi:hypothetical protein
MRHYLDSFGKNHILTEQFKKHSILLSQHDYVGFEKTAPFHLREAKESNPVVYKLTSYVLESTSSIIWYYLL